LLNYKAHSYTIDLRMVHFTCAVWLSWPSHSVTITACKKKVDIDFSK